MDSTIALIVGLVLLVAAVVAVAASARAGRKLPTASQLVDEAADAAAQASEMLTSFYEAVTVAETFVRSAQQLLDKPARFDYVLKQLQTLFPTLPFDLLQAAIEAGVQRMKTEVKPVVLTLPEAPANDA